MNEGAGRQAGRQARELLSLALSPSQIWIEASDSSLS